MNESNPSEPEPTIQDAVQSAIKAGMEQVALHRSESASDHDSFTPERFQLRPADMLYAETNLLFGNALRQIHEWQPDFEYAPHDELLFDPEEEDRVKIHLPSVDKEIYFYGIQQGRIAGSDNEQEFLVLTVTTQDQSPFPGAIKDEKEEYSDRWAHIFMGGEAPPVLILDNLINTYGEVTREQLESAIKVTMSNEDCIAVRNAMKDLAQAFQGYNPENFEDESIKEE